MRPGNWWRTARRGSPRWWWAGQRNLRRLSRSWTFKFIAAKRENRIGWVNEDGERETVRHFCHASDGLYWREATDADLEAAESAVEAKKSGNPAKTPADLKALVPTAGAIPQGGTAHPKNGDG